MDPIQNTPVDPNAIPQDPNAVAPQEASGTAAPQMATPEEMQTLMDLMDDIEQKYSEMNAANFSGENANKSLQKDLITEVFKALQDAGIDLSDVTQVREFLDQLEQSSPDLYELFTTAFNDLLGAEATLPGTEGATPGVNPTNSGAPAANLPGSPDGALAAMSGAGTPPEPVAPTEPTAIPGGAASNPGLSGMVPPVEGVSPTNKFPNLTR